MSIDLKQSLGEYELVAIGIGSTIGCGIFFLFRNIMQRSGKLTALAFLVAAIPNIIASMCYAELAGMYVSNAVEYESLKDAFNETVANVAIYVLLLFLVFNCTTILIFIGEILQLEHFKFYFCLLILLVMSAVNFFGIDTSKKITNTMIIVELTILGIVILFGAVHWRIDERFVLTKEIAKNHNFWVAAFLAIFLYTGYDTIVKLTEETKDPKRNVPRALIITISVVTVIYILLGITAVSLGNDNYIAQSTMPIAAIFETIIGKGSYTKVVYLIGLFIVINTFFICILALSRFLHSLGEDGTLPAILSETNAQFQTPHNAIIAVFVVIAFSLLVESGEWATTIANVFFLAFLVLISLAVIVLRSKEPDRERPFKVPLNVGNVPIPAVLGVLVSVGFIVFAALSTSKIG